MMEELNIIENWCVFRLDEVFQIARGGSPRPIVDYITDSEDGYNWIKIGDTKNIDKYIYRTKQKIKKDGLKKSLLVKENDFILSNSMSFGKPYIMKTEGCIHDGWLLLRKLKEDISVDFMYYVLSSDVIKKQFISKAAGSTVQNLNIKLVESVKALIPPLLEQQKISEILSTVDEKLKSIELQLIETQKLKKGLMQRILVQGIGHTKFKDSVLGKIPHNWEVKKLSEISNVVRGGSPRPAGSPLLFNGSYLPWITVAELTNSSNKYITSTKTMLTKLGSTQTRILEVNTVVLANSGATLGIPRILKIRGGANDGVAAFLELTRISNDYLYFYLQSLTKHFRDQLAPGSGQPNLNTSLIGGVNISIPPIEEQIKITNVLNIIDDKLSVLYNKQSNYNTLKQGLMQKLLTGKIRVKV